MSDKKISLASLKRESTTSVELRDVRTHEPMGVFIHGHPKLSRAYLAISAKHNPPAKQRLYTGKQNYLELPASDPEKQLRIDAEAVTAISDADGNPIDDIDLSAEGVLALFKHPDYEYMGIQWQLHLNEEKND